MAAVYYYPATAIRVCVDEINNSVISGRLYCAQLDDVLNFKDVNELLLGMEKIFDERGYPEPFQRKRSFLKKAVLRISHDDKIKKQAIMREKRTVSQAVGERATFLVYVMTRLDSSWQGRVEWLQNDESNSFSSEVELLGMINKRLGCGASVFDAD